MTRRQAVSTDGGPHAPSRRLHANLAEVPRRTRPVRSARAWTASSSISKGRRISPKCSLRRSLPSCRETYGLIASAQSRASLGALLLAAYFGAPGLAAWPFAGAAPDALVAYARSHELLFCAGGWLQATGALLSGLFLLLLVQLSGA